MFCNFRSKTKGTSLDTYDAVLICTGAQNTPRLSKVEGMDTEYKGQILHMHTYRTNYQFKDKTVLVVGCGNSSADAAADISHAAKQVSPKE